MQMPTTAAELYSDLELLLSDCDIDGALHVLDRICTLFEGHAGAWELRGHLEARVGRPHSSVLYFERARDLGELEMWSSRTLAMQYVAIGNDAAAASELHRLGLSGQLTNNSVLRLVLHDLLTLKRPGLAADIAWQAIESAPDDALLWHELSAIQTMQGEPPEVCLNTVKRAIELAPHTAEFRVTAATIMIRMDQAQAAYQIVREVVAPNQVNLDCPCCLWRLVCIFDCFGDRDRMTACYDRLKRVGSGITFP